MHRNDPAALDSQLDLAERIAAKLTSATGADQTSKRLVALPRKAILAQHRRSQHDVGGSQPSVVNVKVSEDEADDEKEPAPLVPHGFWIRFMRDELHLRPSEARRMRLVRALTQHAARARTGCITRPAYRGLRKGSSKRSHGGA